MASNQSSRTTKPVTKESSTSPLRERPVRLPGHFSNAPSQNPSPPIISGDLAGKHKSKVSKTGTSTSKEGSKKRDSTPLESELKKRKKPSSDASEAARGTGAPISTSSASIVDPTVSALAITPYNAAVASAGASLPDSTTNSLVPTGDEDRRDVEDIVGGEETPIEVDEGVGEELEVDVTSPIGEKKIDSIRAPGSLSRAESNSRLAEAQTSLMGGLADVPILLKRKLGEVLAEIEQSVLVAQGSAKNLCRVSHLEVVETRKEAEALVAKRAYELSKKEVETLRLGLHAEEQRTEHMRGTLTLLLKEKEDGEEVLRQEIARLRRAERAHLEQLGKAVAEADCLHAALAKASEALAGRGAREQVITDLGEARGALRCLRELSTGRGIEEYKRELLETEARQKDALDAIKEGQLEPRDLFVTSADIEDKYAGVRSEEQKG